MEDFEKEFDQVIKDLQSLDIGKGADLDTMIRHSKSFFDSVKRAFEKAPEHERPVLAMRIQEMQSVYQMELQKVEERTGERGQSDAELSRQNPESYRKIIGARKEIQSQAHDTMKVVSPNVPKQRVSVKTRSKVARVPRKKWTKG